MRTKSSTFETATDLQQAASCQCNAALLLVFWPWHLGLPQGSCLQQPLGSWPEQPPARTAGQAEAAGLQLASGG